MVGRATTSQFNVLVEQLGKQINMNLIRSRLLKTEEKNAENAEKNELRKGNPLT